MYVIISSEVLNHVRLHLFTLLTTLLGVSDKVQGYEKAHLKAILTSHLLSELGVLISSKSSFNTACPDTEIANYIIAKTEISLMNRRAPVELFWSLFVCLKFL